MLNKYVFKIALPNFANALSYTDWTLNGQTYSMYTNNREQTGVAGAIIDVCTVNSVQNK